MKNAAKPISLSPLSIKLRADEHARLREAADAAKVGHSTFAAEAVRRAIGTARKRPMQQRPDELAAAIREATGEIGKLNNNLSQIVRAAADGNGSSFAPLTAMMETLSSIDNMLAAAFEHR